ncbi:MAG: response regulator [Candidatus Zixiibacteriota bacterium]
MKVIIVDDSQTVCQALSKIVTQLGYEPIEAANGAEALAKLRTHYRQVGLIILDWNMPVMDGFTALGKIKASDQFKHIPVLMATSDGVKEDVIKALKAGAASYLVKPFDKKKLADTIHELLSTGTPTTKA